MNAAHAHLMLNHAPVLGTAFALGLLLFGLWRRSTELTKAALGALVITALLSVPAYLTGEPAEDLVEALPGISMMDIKHHEEFAQIAFTGALVMGVGALAGLVLFRRGRLVPIWFSWATVGLGVVVGGLMAWTANLGGEIHHSEIRGGPTVGRTTPDVSRE